MSKTKFNFWLDLGLGVLFGIVTLTSFGSGHLQHVFHSFAGLLFTAGCGLHQLLHLDWFKAMRRVSPEKLPPGVRRSRAVVSWLFGLFAGCGLSGLVAQALLETVPTPFRLFLKLFAPAWSKLHALFGLGLIGLTGYHLALHWKWLVANLRRQAGANPAPQP
jgi:hypothetical protein